MISGLLARTGSAALVVFGVVCAVFFLTHLIPGDPVEVLLGESATTAEREQLRQSLGLDKPLGHQWLAYVAGLLKLDLGTSLFSQKPVAAIIGERIGATGLLALAALGVAVAVAAPTGIIAALRKDTLWDQGAMGLALLGVSIPNFWLGPMLILVFSLSLGWLPVSGAGGPASIILPAITLGTGLAAVLSRNIRSALLEVLAEDYIRTARAKGLAPRVVLLRHAAANAGLTVITVLGLQLGAVLGGAVITETVFDWPGIGSLMVEAILRRDYPVVQGCVLLISVIYVAINTATDIVYALLDPRIRFAK
ncbi:MAG: ABC transporter permease [Gammaproteobacteria bacterium]